MYGCDLPVPPPPPRKPGIITPPSIPPPPPRRQKTRPPPRKTLSGDIDFGSGDYRAAELEATSSNRMPSVCEVRYHNDSNSDSDNDVSPPQLPNRPTRRHEVPPQDKVPSSSPFSDFFDLPASSPRTRATSRHNQPGRRMGKYASESRQSLRQSSNASFQGRRESSEDEEWGATDEEDEEQEEHNAISTSYRMTTETHIDTHIDTHSDNSCSEDDADWNSNSGEESVATSNTAIYDKPLIPPKPKRVANTTLSNKIVNIAATQPKPVVSRKPVVPPKPVVQPNPKRKPPRKPAKTPSVNGSNVSFLNAIKSGGAQNSLKPATKRKPRMSAVVVGSGSSGGGRGGGSSGGSGGGMMAEMMARRKKMKEKTAAREEKTKQTTTSRSMSNSVAKKMIKPKIQRKLSVEKKAIVNVQSSSKHSRRTSAMVTKFSDSIDGDISVVTVTTTKPRLGRAGIPSWKLKAKAAKAKNLANDKKKPKLKPSSSSFSASNSSSTAAAVPAWKSKLKKTIRHQPNDTVKIKSTKEPKIIQHKACASFNDDDWDCDDDTPTSTPVTQTRKMATVRAIQKGNNEKKMASATSATPFQKTVRRSSFQKKTNLKQTNFGGGGSGGSGGNGSGNSLSSPSIKHTERRSSFKKVTEVVLKTQNSTGQSHNTMLKKKTTRSIMHLKDILNEMGPSYLKYEAPLIDDGYETLQELREIELDELLEMGMKKGHAKRFIKYVGNLPV